LIPKDISGRCNTLDEGFWNEKQEIVPKELNSESRTIEKMPDFQAEEPDGSSKVLGTTTYGTKGFFREVRYKLDLEKDIAILTHEGEFKKYSKSIMKNAQKLSEKDFSHEDKGWKSLFPRGVLAIMIGMLIFEKYPILAVIAIIYGFYEMEKLDSLDNDSVLEYLEEKRCEKCGKNLAYEETKKPEVREISAPKDYQILIKRFQKCKYCGHERIEEGSEGFTTVKTNIKYSFKKILRMRPKCSKCRRDNAYEDFRKADVRYNNLVRITIRYYKCRYCGNTELKIEESNMGANPYIFG
jgi:hypothetical protein